MSTFSGRLMVSMVPWITSTTPLSCVPTAHIHTRARSGGVAAAPCSAGPQTHELRSICAAASFSQQPPESTGWLTLSGARRGVCTLMRSAGRVSVLCGRPGRRSYVVVLHKLARVLGHVGGLHRVHLRVFYTHVCVWHAHRLGGAW
jgi:hypothetical protein